jgi:phage recombination protein Bet
MAEALKIEEEIQMEQKTGNTALMALPAVDGWTADQIELVKRTVAPGATNDELKMFLAAASKFQLDPLLKQIYFWKDSRGKVSIYTGIDGWRKAAMRDINFAGLESSVVKEGDEFSLDIETGVIKHTITGKRGKIVGAWAKAYHKDPCRRPAVEYCDIDDYKKTSGTWLTNPCDMIKKTAEIHALKKQFSLDGIDIREEVSDEERYGQIRQQLIAPRITPEERMHKITVGIILRSFHSIGVTTDQIEQYIGCPVNMADDDTLDEISEIGRRLVEKKTTWEQLTTPFGVVPTTHIASARATVVNSAPTENLPDMDGTPWAGERHQALSPVSQTQNQQTQGQEQHAAAGNGKEKIIMAKIKGKLEAVYPGNQAAQNDWLGSLFVTSLDELGMLNAETLQPILDDVDGLLCLQWSFPLPNHPQS